MSRDSRADASVVSREIIVPAAYRLELARFIVEAVRPEVKSEGAYEPASSSKPGAWYLTCGEVEIMVTENALLSPDDPALSSVVDVWSSGCQVFSARWLPNQPWILPTMLSQEEANG